MPSVSIDASADSRRLRAAGVPGLEVSVGPVVNGLAPLTIAAVPPGWDHAEIAFDGVPGWTTIASAPTVDTSPDPVVVASATLSGGTWTITVTSPAHYAAGSPYTVTEAQLAAGPHQLLAASVVEAPTGTYTATPGLWAFPADDPPLFTYEWRADTTVFDASDGVAGLVFTPDSAAQTLITGAGLQFRETAANGTATVNEDLVVEVPQAIEAIRFNNTGLLTRNSFDSTSYTKFSIIYRWRYATGATTPDYNVCAFGTSNRVMFEQRFGNFWLNLRNDNGSIVIFNQQQPYSSFPANTWMSAFISVDLSAGLNGNRVAARIHNTTYQSSASTTATNLSVPQGLGGQIGAWSGSNLTGFAPFNGDLAPWAAIFYGNALDPLNSAVWDEVFDPANGNAIRPEYLNGTKTTVGSIQPTVMFRGVDFATGTNTAPGSTHTWRVWGAAPEVILA